MFFFTAEKEESVPACKPPDKVAAKVIDMVKSEVFRSEEIKYYLDPILQLIIDKIKPYAIMFIILLLLLVSGHVFTAWKLFNINISTLKGTDSIISL